MSKNSKSKPIVKVKKEEKQFNAFKVLGAFLIVNVIICWIPIAGISLSGGSSSNTSSNSIEDLNASSKNIEAFKEGSNVFTTNDVDLEEIFNSEE